MSANIKNVEDIIINMPSLNEDNDIKLQFKYHSYLSIVSANVFTNLETALTISSPSSIDK